MTRRSKSRWYARVAAVAVVALLCSSLAASAGDAPRRLAAAPTPNPDVQRLLEGKRDRFGLKLRSRAFVPAPGFDARGIVAQSRDGLGDRVHFLVQMADIPRAEERAALADQGLRLLDYVGGNTYIGSARQDVVAGIAGFEGVRWAGPLAAADKLPAALAQGKVGAWARTAKGRILLAVTMHADVAQADARRVVERLGGTVLSSAPAASIVVASFPFGRAKQVAEADPVQFVDVVEPSLNRKNDTARATANVGTAAAAPYNLRGTGVIGLVYDAGIIAAGHPDFSGRVLETEGGGATVNDHATHVAGTFAGSGANSAANGGTANQWAGYAPGARIRSFEFSNGADVLYDDPGDTNADLTTAMQSTAGGAKGIDLATASLGDTADQARGCSVLGDYVNSSILIDKIVRGAINDADGKPQKLIWTFAAGNERVIVSPGAAGPLVCGDYVTLSSPAPAKNTITVGALNSDGATVTSFSSWGPTSDGRLKPDISAAGCNTTRTAIQSTSSTNANAYTQKCGTSMATPGVAGVAALVIEQWRKNHSTVRPLPHTMKAILVHTAATPSTFPSLVTGAGNSRIMITSRQAAAPITVAYANPGAPNSPISTAVAGSAITVNLQTNAAGALVSTAQDVVDELTANAFDATGTRLVGAALGFGGNFSQPFGGNTGAGVVAAMAATPLSGGGAASGPDYRYGWGMVDAGAAAKLVDEDADGESIRVDEVDDGDVDSIKVFSDGTTDFRATIAWDDVAGTRLPSNALVNDLDLRVVDPSGVEYKPLVLDPQRPRDAAAPGDDPRNNVEMVVAPKKPGMWEVKVSGTIVPQGPQEYTLIAPPPGNSVTVTPSVTTEGDSGTRKASFVVALAHADAKPITLTYTTLGLTANGTDYVATSGSLAYAPGEIEKLVEVEIKGDIDDESEERFDLEVSYQGAGPVGTGIATIVDDDGERTFTVVGKTGDTSEGLSLTGIQPRTVNINDKGQVVFVGRTSTDIYGKMGLWTGKSGEPPVLVNPSWATSDRRVFDYPTIRNDGSIFAWDRQSGAPPSWFIRDWTKPLLFGGWNQSVLVRSGGEFDAVTTPNASVDGGYFTFLSIVGNGTYVQWGPDGADGTWGNVQSPVPVIADDGSTAFRQVMKDGNGAPDYVNAPLRIVNVYGAGSGQITCSGASGCPHPGFTNIGWHPGLSRDGSVVGFYGERAVAGGPAETGMWASVRSASGARTLVRIAKIGDAGITGFSDEDQDERLGINSTQEDHKQVTVVFRATSEGGLTALYKARIVYEGPVGAPTGYHVDGPTLIVRQGDTIDGVGAVESFAIGDHPINNRNEGDIAFMVKAGAVEAAVVAEADDAPVLFVPGIAGTELYDLTHNESVWLWPPSFFSRDTYWGKALSMREEDQDGREIVPADALRQALSLPFGITAGDIYKPLFDKLTDSGYKEYALGTHGANVRTCDTGQLQDRPNLFIFPYDWRRSNAVNAALLKNYMACVKRFYPDTKVNVLTHSMGGLLTRRTIISQPGFADDVNTLFTVTPPWLGAPKLIYVLRSGDFIPTLASGPGVRRAAAALPGAHQLMPSAGYFSIAGTPYGELGRDFDGDGNANSIYATFDAVKTLLDRKYPRFKPGSTAAAFHGYAGQDDWSADTYSYKFVEIYGEQSTAKTIGGVHETTKVICEAAADSVPGAADPGETCDTSYPLLLTWTNGDGTVPTASAARNGGMQPPDAQLIPFAQAANGGGDSDYDHNGILGNETVLDRIVEILAENGGPPDPNAPAPLAANESDAPAPSSLRLALAPTAGSEPGLEAVAAEPGVDAALATEATVAAAPDEVSSIVVYGAAHVVAKDDAGNSTEPEEQPDGTARIEQIPGVDVYAIDDEARLFRSTSGAPLEVTFEAAGPVEVELRRENAAGTAVEATRYLDVGLPAGTPVQLTTEPGSAPALRYDGNGDGTYEGPVAVDVHVTGAAAADVTPPAIAVQRSLAADDMLDVSITTTDTGSGVRTVRYSLDGSTFEPYTGPFRVDPANDLNLMVIAQDFAGNRGTSGDVAVGKSGAERPVADPITASTTEDTAVDIDLPAPAAGVSFRYTVKSAPSHGTVALLGSRVRYTPEQDFNGVDSFTYVVDDGLLRSAPGTVTVSVGAVNDAPRLTIVGPASVGEGAAAVAYHADVVDPEGDAVSTVWSVAGASLDAIGDDAELAAGDGPASATVTVESTDEHGDKTIATRVVAIQNVAPVALPGGPRSGPWGVPILFSGLVTDASAADSAVGFTTRWSFGDTTPNAGGPNVSHTYVNPGSYTATFSATDKDGATGSATSAVSVLKRNTTLAYTGSTGTVPYGYARLSAQLSDSVNVVTSKLAGRRITFAVGLQALTANTDANGAATVVLASPLSPGTYTVTARFTGDTAYNLSTAPSAQLKVASSVGSVTGTDLVALSNGARASFNVSSMDGSTVRGTLEYVLGASTIRSTTLTPMGIAADGRSAWFAGVSTTGQQLRAYVEDTGATPAADRFQLWVNGVLQNGDGRLSAGGVSIVRP